MMSSGWTKDSFCIRFDDSVSCVMIILSDHIAGFVIWNDCVIRSDDLEGTDGCDWV